MDEQNKTNIYKEKGRLYTLSNYPGFNGFGEGIIVRGKKEYRVFDTERSKLAAALKKGLSQTGISQGSKVLYLGASHGYTPSYISDIVGKNGVVFCLDFSPVVARDLVYICEQRDNMIPLLADASNPDSYEDRITKVDVLFQDVAQKDQIGIFKKNFDKYVGKGGFGLLALKARSHDIRKKPKQVFKETRKELDELYNVVDYRELHPFEKDHALFVVKK